MLVAKGANHQNDGEVRRRDNLMSAPGPSRNIAPPHDLGRFVSEADHATKFMGTRPSHLEFVSKNQNDRSMQDNRVGVKGSTVE